MATMTSDYMQCTQAPAIIWQTKTAKSPRGATTLDTPTTNTLLRVVYLGALTVFYRLFL